MVTPPYGETAHNRASFPAGSILGCRADLTDLREGRAKTVIEQVSRAQPFRPAVTRDGPRLATDVVKASKCDDFVVCRSTMPKIGC